MEYEEQRERCFLFLSVTWPLESRQKTSRRVVLQCLQAFCRGCTFSKSEIPRIPVIGGVDGKSKTEHEQQTHGGKSTVRLFRGGQPMLFSDDPLLITCYRWLSEMTPSRTIARTHEDQTAKNLKLSRYHQIRAIGMKGRESEQPATLRIRSQPATAATRCCHNVQTRDEWTRKFWSPDNG